MLALALFSWWYTTAWKNLAQQIERRVDRCLDFFSVGLLFRTLFDPFRQISAGSVRGSMDVKMRAFADRSFSRVFGAFVRTLFIVLGLLTSAVLIIVGFVQLILWPVVPFLPFIGLAGFALGWVR
ncbi:MAG TPA: hypothetical protein VJ843_04475 [Candidatus Saccharimonadales bacterium]|nr:hypothetical protein [Candidatus Saccharimonadales bacterium]